MRSFVWIGVACCVAMVVGCSSDVKSTNADAAQREATKAAMNEAQRQVGMPAITNFQERKLAKMIFELRDQEDFVCHAYLVNQMTGEVGQYLGKCLGYGLPYSVQFTNPEKLVYGHRELGERMHEVKSAESIRAVPQADPNGLFMPSGLSATWIMLYDTSAEEFRPVYVEPQILVSPFELK